MDVGLNVAGTTMYTLSQNFLAVYVLYITQYSYHHELCSCEIGCICVWVGVGVLGGIFVLFFVCFKSYVPFLTTDI